MEDFEKNEITENDTLKEDVSEQETPTENVSEPVCESETEVNEVANQPAEETNVFAETPVETENASEDTPLDQQRLEEQPQDNAQFEQPHTMPPLEPIDYSPVNRINDKKPASKGLKVFSLILAAVILLTGACSVGYLAGRNSILHKGNKSFSSKELAAKPKNTDEMTAAEVYEKIDPSIVGISVYNANGESSYASGVIYSNDGYIVTNDHIYAEVTAPKFKIYASDGKQYSAEYVAGDVVSDLAVLKIDANGLKAATFGNSADIFCGENVVAIGKPTAANDKSTITKGIVSLTSTRVQTTSSFSARLIQTDSAINPGSSGGALSNMYGQVIGITSSKLAGAVYDSIGYAIPSVTVKRVADQLIKDKKVTNRAKLGISYTQITAELAEINGVGTVGLSIAEVSEESDLYGKVEVGDIITHIDGVELTDDDIILNTIEDANVGDTITLTIKKTSGAVNDYTCRLIANIGESSYDPVLSQKKSESNDNSGNGNNGNGNGNGNDNNGGTFNFPFGY